MRHEKFTTLLHIFLARQNWPQLYLSILIPKDCTTKQGGFLYLNCTFEIAFSMAARWAMGVALFHCHWLRTLQRSILKLVIKD